MPQPQPRWTTAGEVAQVDLPPGGSTGQVLAKTSNVDREVDWTTVAGTGDVVGPASATTDHLAVFADETGKLLKDGGAPSGGSSNVSIIDLGVVNAGDVVRAGVIELVPFVPGRFIKGWGFFPDNFVLDDQESVALLTPNSLANQSWFFGFLSGYDSDSLRRNDVAMQIDGLPGNYTQILDHSPLYAVELLYGSSFAPPVTWSAITARVKNDWIVDVPTGFIRYVTTGGITGASEPDWSSTGTPVTDGTVEWSAATAIPTGNAHIWAEVVDIPDATVPPIPTTIEWVTQPTTQAAGVLDPAPQVRLLDQNDDPYVFPQAGAGINLVGVGTGIGTINPAILFGDADPETGIFTFDNIDISTPGTGYRLRANFFYGVGVTPVDSNPFNITAP